MTVVRVPAARVPAARVPAARAPAARALLGGLGLGIFLLSACGGSERAPIEGAARRVLVVSLPGVGWDDVEAGSLPAVSAFVEDAAVANLATRIGRAEASAEAAYLTIGAGTRAVLPESVAEAGPRSGTPEGIVGVALEAGEAYHGQTADEVVERRMGIPPAAVTYLGVGAARTANDASRYGAEVGLVGSLLADAGIVRAVIGNADHGVERTVDLGVERPADLGAHLSDDRAYGRSAVAALMDRNGQLPAGRVAADLLVDEPTAAFGVRLDPEAVLAAFDRVWSAADPIVVLVEASDLLRTQADRSSLSAEQRRSARATALAGADAMLAELLARTEVGDAVVLLAPLARAGEPHLGVVAVRAPGVDAGYLASATTRRTGYVQLGDVGPTILQLAGVEPPEEIEGRGFTITSSGDDDRVAHLADGAAAAEFRDEVLPLTVTLLITFLVGLAAAAILLTRLGRPAGARARRRCRVALRFLALASLGTLPATFLAGAAGFDGGPTAAYLAFLAVVGLGVAGAATAADRRWSGVGPIVGVAGLALVIVGDVLVGAPLQLNSTFGYSVAVAGRFAGLGNLAFALVGSAGIVTAALLAEWGGTRGVRAALVVLVTVVLVDGLPMFGGDVGGILSMVPAYGLAGLVLVGRRVGARSIAAVGAAAVAMLVAVAFLDLARPAASQTHLARLADHVVEGRWSPLLDAVGRRWTASFGAGQVGAWVILLVVSLGLAGYLLALLVPDSGRQGALGSWSRPSPTGAVGAAAVGLAVLGTVGVVTNDSSFVVPATMLLVVAPVLVHREVTSMDPRGAS